MSEATRQAYDEREIAERAKQQQDQSTVTGGPVTGGMQRRRPGLSIEEMAKQQPDQSTTETERPPNHGARDVVPVRNPRNKHEKSTVPGAAVEEDE